MSNTNKAIAIVQRFEVRKTRRGDDFANLTLNRGREGGFASIPAKIWQFDRVRESGVALPAEGSMLEVHYKADEYQGQVQWTLQEFRVLEGEERAEALGGFERESEIDSDYYKALLESLLDEADPKHSCGRIVHEIFDDAKFREAFYRAPAAVRHHQNYPGGLLEHTLNVTSVALAIAASYAGEGRPGLTLNREIAPVDRIVLIAAGLLHDIGKLDTYDFAPLAQITEANRFEGHLPISYAVVRPLTQAIKADPPYEGAADEVDKLLNCILSHHGILEYGSPVTPACLEAFILSQGDVVDARVASIVSEGNEMLRANPTARWLRHFHFPGGMFIGDWPEPERHGDSGGPPSKLNPIQMPRRTSDSKE